MVDNNPTRLLDLTRLVSRAGRPRTGVDRVEFAYLEHLLKAGPLFGLVRSSLGYILLDCDGCTHLFHRLQDGVWGAADWRSRIKRLAPDRARAESDLRRFCLDRCLPLRLGAMLRRHLPKGLHYLNTGHTNLTRRMLQALAPLDPRLAVLIHDTIPLDHPEYQRPGAEARFRSFLLRVGHHANLIICNSKQTERALYDHLAQVPQTIVAPLGVDPPEPGEAPQGPWKKPYFVALGTIEPRKNHALLLDIWPEIPEAELLVLGSRGWQNAEVFDRLDSRPPRVHERAGLSDGEAFALLQGSVGLLFPSHAEGYGLPPIEAAALRVPVLCNDLAIYRETLGDIPIYAQVSDRYLWTTTIKRMAIDHATGQVQAPLYRPPTWDAHFKTVLTMI